MGSFEEASSPAAEVGNPALLDKVFTDYFSLGYVQ